ncbi:hypothetical protein [Paenibacillus sp. 1P07SE]|uniref:hypothetical protein n=1 Tax=Paenibacillus sp. 1P07SE TaxID=3132209 RepID=UPI0039A42194
MNSLDQYKRMDSVPSITWDLKWISEWESPWSIFEKIKLANLAVKKDLFQVFGNEEVRSYKSILGKKNHDLYGLYAFDDDAFMSIIGFRLKKFNRDCLHNISDFLHKNDIQRSELKGRASMQPYKYFRNHLHFCLDCMKTGFHSILHQFKLLHNCPFHLNPMHSTCPECHTMIPYELSDKYFQAPFVCNCGYSFMDFNSPYHMEWGKVLSEHVQDPVVCQWLTLKEEDKMSLKRVHFYPHNNPEHNPTLLSFLLDTINTPHTKDRKRNVKKSCSPITQRADRDISGVRASDNTNMLAISNWVALETNQRHGSISKTLSDLTISSNLTMKSISSYLRKTVLTNHKSCIKRFVRISKEIGADHPPVCPFAYAYVMWKKSLWGIPNYYDVEDTPYHREGSSLQKLSSEFDRDYIVDLMDTWIQLYPIRTPLDLARFEWMLNKATGQLALLHFQTWLRIAPRYAAEFKIASDSDILKNENFTLAFAFPKEPNLPTSFIYSSREDEVNWLLETNHIVCPYSSVKKRRRKATEVSHHPMRLAMEKLNGVDRNI